MKYPRLRRGIFIGMDLHFLQYTRDNGKNPLRCSPQNMPSTPYQIVEYKFPCCFNYVNLRFFLNWDSIIRAATDDTNTDKWLIFVKTKEEGEYLKKTIGKCADFFNADVKGEDLNILRKLVQGERFEKEY